MDINPEKMKKLKEGLQIPTGDTHSLKQSVKKIVVELEHVVKNK